MNFFDNKIEFLKGVGPQKAAALGKELGITTFGDLLEHYPFRHEDRSSFHTVAGLNDSMPSAQIKGKITHIETIGEGRKKRLTATFRDETGAIELVWFKGITWVAKNIQPGVLYVAYGKPARFGSKFSIAHPEMEVFAPASQEKAGLQPVYHSTEKLKVKYLDSKGIAKLTKALLPQAESHIQETLPSWIINHFKFISKKEAVMEAHYPKDAQQLAKAKARLKFEELFYIQLKMLNIRFEKKEQFPGQVFAKIPTMNVFYKEHLPFDLTGAQKRVIREIYEDCKSGKQMNRLLQGDVGSGKTIVAFICMLMALDNGAQACMMAPTEILADQHYRGLKEFADMLGIQIALLTGSTKTKARKEIHAALLSGELQIIVGTHALLEDVVEFKNLGLCVIDEQHRFGVAQRAKLWKKRSLAHPHMLVMTATPIPRTLAMTLYGDLDVSIIDELPKGRKPILTTHYYEDKRLKVFGFIKKQLALGRQTYIVYPLIEESEKMDYKNLMEGFEAISRAFPNEHLSIVHGKQKSEDKDYEMQRFAKHETSIMVATTVIEVGVNVPNATVMVIENAERFGLSQLHQLRGRVGRGGDQSYCILMTDYKISKEGKTRLETMVQTNNGFEIADVDLKLRGPGDMGGTQQSGVVDLKFADLAKDSAIIQQARMTAEAMLDKDPKLEAESNAPAKRQLAWLNAKQSTNWSRIS